MSYIVTVVVSGSRGINDYDLARNAFVMSTVWKKFKSRMKIIHGDCKGSPDMLADKFAKNNNIPREPYPADWDDITVKGAIVRTNKYGKKYNKNAGILRNIEMAEKSDILIAIWDGSSTGTKQMIDYCIQLGIYCYVLDTSTGEVIEENKEKLDDI